MDDRKDDPSIEPLDVRRDEARTTVSRRRGWLIAALIAAAVLVLHVAQGGIQRHLGP